MNPFQEVWDTNAWGCDETRSGGGSTLETTRELRAELIKMLESSGATLLDIPCGDGHWISQMFRENPLPGVRYFCGDIVPEAVELCLTRVTAARNTVNLGFVGALPFSGAPIYAMSQPPIFFLCKDLFLHLSLNDIQSTLDFILAMKPEYLLASHTPGAENRDQATGYHWRDIDLTAKPFLLPPPTRMLPCSIGLWDFTQNREARLWSPSIPGMRLSPNDC